METIELVIYITAAIAVAGLAVYLIADTPIQEYAVYVQKTLLGKNEQEFKHVDDIGFIEELVAFWKEKQWSDKEDTLVLFYKTEGSISKQELFRKLKANNLCRTIQSRSFGCGEREDVVMDRIELPSVVRITYTKGILVITPAKQVTMPNTTYGLQFTEFDGFVGNGVVSFFLGTLPSDAEITHMMLEGIFGSDFDLSIDGNHCNMTFYPDIDVSSWDITRCAPQPGIENIITFNFHSPDIYRNYIAGAYISIVYRSLDEITAESRRKLPDIDGSVNFYGSVDFAGPPEHMAIFLNYTVGELNGTDFYVKVQNNTVYKDNISGRTLQKKIDIPLQFISQGTNLLRIGIGSNISSITEISLPQPVDVVLITDTSGSMKWQIGADYNQMINGILRSCLDPRLMEQDTQKISLAKCFGKEFVGIVLEKFRQNRIGLVEFGSSVKSFTNLTSDKSFLEVTIDGYDADGGTCLSCSIQRASLLLEESDRPKAMVIMTDGCANHIIPGVNVQTDNTQCYSARAFNEALEQARLAREMNISLYTIGFGKMDPAGLQLLQDIACLDNCSNYGHGEDAGEIQRIYQNFAERIAKKQAIQTKHVQGSGESALPQSSLHGSYIEHSPVPAPRDGLKVGIMQSIGCIAKPSLPEDIVSARIISWAGTLWTLSVKVDSNVLLDSSPYQELISIGDPFSITIPEGILSDGSTIACESADVKLQKRCANNDLLYFARPAVQNYTFADGCHWQIEMRRGIMDFDIPSGYIGDRYCAYTHKRISYNESDKYQGSVASILGQIDKDGDGKIEEDIKRIFIVG